MNCDSILNILDLYAEKRLTAARTQKVAAHLKGCRGCSRAEAALAPVSISQGAGHAPAAFKKDLAELLAGRLAAPRVPAEPWLRLPRPEEFPAFAGAAAYACLLLLLAVAGPGVTSQSLGGGKPVVGGLR